MKKYFMIWIMRVILITLIIFWMSIIFGFSAEDGTESQSFSDKITIKVLEVIEPEYENLDINKKQQIFDRTSFIVRKTGHFGEYGILGVLVICFFMTFKQIRNLRKSKLWMMALTTLVCMIYAATDEFHQGFVDGRSPKLMDVMIDTAGGLSGAIFVVVICYLLNRKRKENGIMEE